MKPSSSAAQNRRRIREGHLTPEQLQAVFDACERVQDRLLLRLAYSYGLRATEVATLLLSDIDLKQSTIEINRPFLYLIRDRGAGTILFIGRVTDPTAAA